MSLQFDDSIQMQCINHGTGPAMVLAGPGSGKTYIITQRVKHLIYDLSVNPKQILVITFTKSAASNMKERFKQICPDSYYLVNFGTFHSIFYQIIKLFSHGKSPKIIDNFEKEQIIKNIIRGKNKYTQMHNYKDESTEELIKEISLYKGNLNNIDSLEWYDKSTREEFIYLYNEYTEALKNINSIDYDDILINCYELLSQNPDIQKKVQNLFSYILVDEFQDINDIQYEILKLIINKNQNIFIVGDDDQSIYGFRGAKPDIMNNFKEYYKDTSVYSLIYNYRSTKEIIDSSTIVISENKDRIKNYAQIPRCNQISIENSFNLKLCNDTACQTMEIKSVIEKMISSELSVCILLRTNKDSNYYASLFKDFGASSSSDYRDNYEYYIFDTVKAYLSYVIYCDAPSLNLIFNRPNRYLSNNMFSDNLCDINELAKKFTGTWQGDALQIFARNIEFLKKTKPLTFYHYLIKIIGLYDHFVDHFPTETKENIDYILNILQELSVNCLSLKDYLVSVNNYIQEKISRKTHLTAVSSKLSVMTFHASKGLEFDCVIIPDVNEGKIPGRISLAKDALNEERRLFYVAMTRARKYLYIMAIKNEGSNRVLPSRFLNSLIKKQPIR